MRIILVLFLLLILIGCAKPRDTSTTTTVQESQEDQIYKVTTKDHNVSYQLIQLKRCISIEIYTIDGCVYV